MPLYEFECDKCSHITEKIVKSCVRVVFCEKCGVFAAKKIISSGTFIINGYAEKNNYNTPSSSRK